MKKLLIILTVLGSTSSFALVPFPKAQTVNPCGKLTKVDAGYTYKHMLKTKITSTSPVRNYELVILNSSAQNMEDISLGNIVSLNKEIKACVLGMHSSGSDKIYLMDIKY